MAVLNVNNLGMAFAGKSLFADASFTVEDNDKLGLIGANGAGKTTLFRLITGDLEPSDGGIFLSRSTRLGFVEQHACNEPDLTAYQEVLKVFSHLIRMEQDLDSLPAKINQAKGAEQEALIHKQAKLLESFQNQGGLTYKSRSMSMLTGLGFTDQEIKLPVGSLSGGQKTKISLGKLLLSDANFILLDEPTNHLDIKSIEWLEDFISKYTGAAIIISHDRYFLDKVTNKTMQITNKKTYITKGNYSRFMQIRSEQKLYEEREYEKATKEISRIEGIIGQQKRFNRKKNFITIASKQKQIDRIESTLAPPDLEEKTIKINFEMQTESGNDVLYAENLSKSYGDKCLFSNVNLDIKRGEKVFLIGPNGCGKTTLLKILMRKVKQDSGIFRFGVNVRPGYFEQNPEIERPDETIVDRLQNTFPAYLLADLRNILAAFLFRGDDVFKKMGELSGGERARVSLLEIMLKESNLLILDEPTNHLDISSREVLEEALENYEGTLICVSHDRYLINRLASRIVAFTPKGVLPYQGNYDDYIENLEEAPSQPKKRRGNDEYKLRKERESLERKRLSRIAKIQQEIAKIDEALVGLEEELGLEENISDHEKILALTEQMHDLNTKSENLFAEWQDLEDEKTE